METPVTGMWGSPGDYPADFVTIDDLDGQLDEALAANRITACRVIGGRLSIRMDVRDSFLDLAEDLDARGLVLTREIDTLEISRASWRSGYDFARTMLDFPSSPNTGS